jgi:hypothetical protein
VLIAFYCLRVDLTIFRIVHTEQIRGVLVSFFPLSLLLYFYRNIGDNVQFKCTEGKWETLETITPLDICFVIIKLREILDRVILAPNLKFFTTHRSETLVLISVSCIGIILLAQ